MNLLLDTCALLWWLDDHPSLSRAAREVIAAPDSVVWVSAASIWEIAIKAAQGRLAIPAHFEEVLAAQGFEDLDITRAHALQVRRLPNHHRDPFDRLLVAQAMVEGLRIVTRDQDIRRYDVGVIVA